MAGRAWDRGNQRECSGIQNVSIRPTHNKKSMYDLIASVVIARERLTQKRSGLNYMGMIIFSDQFLNFLFFN
jgi:hypothetical protein